MADIVRRYGRFKYGEAQYGLDATMETLFGLCIDFEHSGFFNGRNDGLLCQSFTIERGRRHWIKPDGRGFEEEMTGKMSVIVADPDQLYNPYGGGPLSLGANRPVQLLVKTALYGEIYQLFTGTLTDLKFRDGVIPTAEFNASDGWDYLRSRSEEIVIPLQEGKDSGACISLILDAIHWRWGYTNAQYGSNFGATGPRAIPYWWMDGGNVAKEITNIVFAELGRVCITGDGRLWFQSKLEVLDPIAQIGDADIEEGSLEISAPWETQRNSVTIITTPRTVSPEVTIWQSGEPILVEGYQSYKMTVEFKYNGETVPAKSIVQPVPVTDYQANTLQDGSGTDVTNNFTLIVTPSGNQATLTFYNNGGSAGYLLAGSKIRGQAVYELPTISTTDSIITGKADKVEFVLQSPAYQSVKYAPYDAALLVQNLTRGEPYISFTLKPNPDLQFKIDLGQVVNLVFTKFGGGGVVVPRRVCYIKHEFRQPDNVTRTTLFTEPVLHF